MPQAPTDKKELLSAAELMVGATLEHAGDVARSLFQAVNYIEDMLHKQLIAAVGKQLTAKDFAEYMRFHYRKVFLPSLVMLEGRREGNPL